MKKDITPRDEKGYKHGYWVKSYDDGKVSYKGYFVRGKKQGYHLTYGYGMLLLKQYFYLGEKMYNTTKGKIIW